MMRDLFKRLAGLYWRFIASPEEYCRHIGVKIGRNCLIGTRNMSTEPYLISIGDNVQLTAGVTIHTHGGGMSFALKSLILMYLAKSSLKTGLISERTLRLCQE